MFFGSFLLSWRKPYVKKMESNVFPRETKRTIEKPQKRWLDIRRQTEINWFQLHKSAWRDEGEAEGGEDEWMSM